VPTVASLGEFGLIARIARMTPTAPSVVEGIGDDCAVLRIGDRLVLVSCDLSIENVHWRRSHALAESIGWKAAASALSDIAAMGGAPLFCLVSLACPDDTETSLVDGLYEGMLDAVKQCGAVIVGGDTTRSADGIVIDVVVIGEPVGDRYLTRKGAQPGDALVVTGRLGLSAAGLHALESDRGDLSETDSTRPAASEKPRLLRAHCHPTPRIQEGQWLAARPVVHAMIDISDGLIQDAGHLAEAAHLGVDVDQSMLSVDPDLMSYCREGGLDPYDFMLAGGEDYELAFAVAGGRSDALVQAFRGKFHTDISVVGTFTDAWQGVRIAGEPPSKTGFDHFRQP